MPREAREKFVLDLLQSNQWNTSNTYGLKPHISFGWFDEAKDQPQVTISQPEEGPVGGGRTGYDGFDGQGGTPHQTISGTIRCHAWAKSGALSGASTANPRQYNSAVKDEIYRLVRANADAPTNPSTGNQPLDTFAPGTASPAPEPDLRGVFHYVVPVRYTYGED